MNSWIRASLEKVRILLETQGSLCEEQCLVGCDIGSIRSSSISGSSSISSSYSITATVVAVLLLLSAGTLTYLEPGTFSSVILYNML
jgi:hypothetical protein